MARGFSVEPFGRFGAAVTGLDLDGPVDPAVAKSLYDAWLEYGIFVFPGAGTSIDKHVTLSEVFGALEVHPVEYLRHKANEKLMELGTPETKGPPFIVDGEKRAGYIYWHQDTAFTPNLCKGSILRMINLPDSGGDTIWCDTAGAYDDLPASMKKRIANVETLQAYRMIPPPRMWGMPGHSAALMRNDKGEFPVPEFGDLPLVRHPMVVTHPETGRKSLLLSPWGFMRVLDMGQDEGDALFDEVVAHTVQAKYCYRHTWGANDMVLWDNRRTMHTALGYPYDMTRVGLRTTLKGHMAVGRYYAQ